MLEKSTSNTHDKNSRGSAQPDAACGAHAATTPSAWDDTEKQNPAAPAVRDDALYIPTSLNPVPALDHFWRVEVAHSCRAPKNQAVFAYFTRDEHTRIYYNTKFQHKSDIKLVHHMSSCLSVACSPRDVCGSGSQELTLALAREAEI